MNKDQLFFEHIVREVDFLLTQSEDLSFEKFSQDEILMRAFVRSLEIIGEAVKNISVDIKSRYNSIEWKKIAGLRDRLIHHYFGINWTIVWDVVQNKIPVLGNEIKNLMAKEYGSE